MPEHQRRLAYLSLQAVVEGQDSWAAVTEIVRGLEAEGWTVDRFFPTYRCGAATGVLERLREAWSVQRRLWSRVGAYDALYVRCHPFARPSARRAKRMGVPVVQECNGPYEDMFIAWPALRLARRLFERLQREQYREASAVICVSEGLARWVRAETGNPHVVTNGNGANTAVFTPRAPRRPGLPDDYAVFFGQFAEWQGIGTLLEAVARPEWPADLPLVFVGDGVMRPDVERAATALPGRVILLGRLPYAHVPGVVAHAVASFVPVVMTAHEAMHSPLKLYESMACGVPVVGSDTAGIAEVVREHDCGTLVPPGDARALALAAAGLLADPERAREMGVRGREAAEALYSWRARARQRGEIVAAAVERARTVRA